MAGHQPRSDSRSLHSPLFPDPTLPAGPRQLMACRQVDEHRASHLFCHHRPGFLPGLRGRYQSLSLLELQARRLLSAIFGYAHRCYGQRIDGISFREAYYSNRTCHTHIPWILEAQDRFPARATSHRRIIGGLALHAAYCHWHQRRIRRIDHERRTSLFLTEPVPEPLSRKPCIQFSGLFGEIRQ